MLTRPLLCLLFALAMPAMAQALPEVAVRRIDAAGQQVFEVSASGSVKASPAAVWKVLTDYDAMSEFVPDLTKSKVMSRSGNRVIIEQVGVARFLFMSRSIHLVVQAAEEPISAIDITLVAGDMKVYACRWELTALPDGGTRVSYSGTMVPKFYVPGMLGSSSIRDDIDRMMTAVLERMDQQPR